MFSTVAQNGQTKCWLQRGAIHILRVFNNHRQEESDEGRSVRNLLDVTKSHAKHFICSS